MGTPLSRKGNRHQIQRRVQLPVRPAPDTEKQRAEKEAAKVNWLKRNSPRKK